MIFITYGGIDEGMAQARADGSIVVWICIFVAAVHFAVPFRFRFLLWVDLAMCCVFPSSVVASGTWQGFSSIENTVTIILIISLALLGKHHTEHTERELFAKYLQEKTLRVATEFRLSEEQTKRVTTERVATDASSSYAFDCIGKTGDVLRDLQGVLELGRREHWIVEADTLEVHFGQVLGQGGFGKVCAARLHGSPVAVKLQWKPLDASTRALSTRIRALGSELRVLRRLRHPNIVAFHGAVMLDAENEGKSSQFGIVLERVFGLELSKFVTSAPSTCFLPIAVDMTRALQYMHSQTPQVLHADLKPSNILVETMFRRDLVWPRAKLIDFGVARVLDPAGTWGLTGGTRSWMAPEQRANGQAVSAASDVFALGAVVRYMETGEPPGKSGKEGAGVTSQELAWQLVSCGTSRAGDVKRPFLSDKSRGAMVSCLSLHPEDRPEDMDLVREHLEADIPAELDDAVVKAGSVSVAACPAGSVSRPGFHTSTGSVDSSYEIAMIHRLWNIADDHARAIALVSEEQTSAVPAVHL